MTTNNEDIVAPYIGYVFWIAITLLLTFLTTYVFDEDLLFNLTMIWGLVGMIVSPIIYTRYKRPLNKMKIFVITYLSGLILLALIFLMFLRSSMSNAFM